MHPVITIICVSDAGILHAEAIMFTTLVIIHEHRLNRLSRMHCRLQLALYQLPCQFDNNSCRAPGSHFCPHHEVHQSKMGHSACSVQRQTSQPQNVQPSFSSAALHSSICANPTFQISWEARNGIPLIFMADVYHRNTGRHRWRNVWWAPPVWTTCLNHETSRPLRTLKRLLHCYPGNSRCEGEQHSDLCSIWLSLRCGPRTLDAEQLIKHFPLASAKRQIHWRSTDIDFKPDVGAKRNICISPATGQYVFRVQFDNGSHHVVSFFRKTTYRINILIGAASNAISTRASLFYTGTAQIYLIKASYAQHGRRLVSQFNRCNCELWAARSLTKTHRSLFIRIGNLAVRTSLEIVENLAVDVLLGMYFIHRCVCSIVPTEWKVVPWRLPPVAKISP